MLFSIVSEEELTSSPRWNVESFLLVKDICSTHSDFEMTALYNLVTLRKESINPFDFPEKKYNYIGLENISQNDGELIGDIKKVGFDIKSRSRVFYSGDVLYGKLRPNLNKCLLVDKDIDGICSSEIIVLIPNLKLINPVYLRELLLSKYVSEHVMSMTSGATLPRLNVQEFLELKVPFPPLNMQVEISNRLLRKREIINSYEDKINKLKKTISLEFNAFIEKKIINDETDM
ncbi:restriction endonuclease subunit S [Citrobacter sp. Cpo091]|uniref:restriction endonuclease subunit S n=1 Tax=Citrobacter sp. Cpo091 TaxID=2985140 RepID=UPI00257572B6|nr:restriction endonuclease subunit S [Citrobacter sp. Cpo091]MDM2835769.1 restriction endonuclease subunit S [Citrobacter sp. Cpo091]